MLDLLDFQSVEKFQMSLLLSVVSDWHQSCKRLGRIHEDLKLCTVCQNPGRERDRDEEGDKENTTSNGRCKCSKSNVMTEF